MDNPDRQAAERRRLEMLRSRDGEEAARRWAAWAANLYRSCLEDPRHYASHAEKRELFLKSMTELEQFARTGTVP